MAKSTARLAAEQRVIRERMVPRILKDMGASNKEIDRLLVLMGKSGTPGGFFASPLRGQIRKARKELRRSSDAPSKYLKMSRKELAREFQRALIGEARGEKGLKKVSTKRPLMMIQPTNYKDLRGVIAHEGGHYLDWLKNKQKFHSMAPLQHEFRADKSAAAYLKQFGKKGMGAHYIQDRLRAEALQITKQGSILGTWDPIKQEVRRHSTATGTPSHPRYTGVPHTIDWKHTGGMTEATPKAFVGAGKTPYKYGVHVLKKAGLMGLLLALMLPMFMSEKKNA